MYLWLEDIDENLEGTFDTGGKGGGSLKCDMDAVLLGEAFLTLLKEKIALKTPEHIKRVWIHQKKVLFTEYFQPLKK